MSEKKSFYITTTLPYVNAEPHIGFALEILQADVLARWNRELGKEVFFNTGTDEHGQKIFEAAEKAGKDVQEYTDYYAEKFEELKSALSLTYNAFVRTTNENHIKAVQEIWKRCKDNDDIYEKEFEGLYCVGCERFLSQRDLIDGKCHIHQAEPQLLKEKNWFFKFKRYEEKLLKYLQNPEVIIPDWRREEAINFVRDGLEDFSISRDKSRLSWGIPVPEDDTQVMYVWFDALTSYISTLGWPNEEEDFKKFWTEGSTLQVAGKDQVRFQSLMWQAMLMSVNVRNTDKIFYHGFINSGGQKMSKLLGNVISPYELVEKYGTDATRYLLLRHIHSTEDTDVTWERLDEWYESGLVNGLGNLVARIMKLSETYVDKLVFTPHQSHGTVQSLLTKFEIHKALDHIWGEIADLDVFIQNEKPWESKDPEVLNDIVSRLYHIAHSLIVFMPETAKRIEECIEENKKPENLFPRLNA
ncbi:MAG: methionine--tRNA ligase [Candidatus Zambryskibacteria bacterium]|nr:methionine--tRNA ligase [Candidatus Zambryskibacteria bacterium]